MKSIAPFIVKFRLLSLFLVALFVFISGSSSAQQYLHRPDTGSQRFVEMQRSFDAWKKTVDLKKTRGWKYFKRWEMDLQMHTDAHGNPVDPATYIDIVTRTAEERHTGSSSRFMTAGWSPVGPNVLPDNLTGYMENGIGRINCIAFHPSDANTYFVGVAQGGVWKTSNNGVTWTPLTDNLPITRISDIAIDPVNPNIMYISVGDFEYIGFGLNLNGKKRNTHYGLGVYKTIDGGNTWQPTTLSFQLTNGDASLIRKVLIQPSNTSNLVACGVNGMYKSTNAGATWTHVLDSLFWDVVADPVTPTTLYASTGWVLNSNTGTAGIYKSTDFGTTWTLLNTGIPLTGSVQRIKLAVAPNDANYIYALAVDASSGFYGFYKSTDAGVNWQFINNGVNILNWDDGLSTGGQGTYDLALMINPTDKNTVYVGGINPWISTDGAQNFDPVSHWTLSYGPTLHGDIHFIERQPLTGNIFVCSDGGLYRTSNMISQPWTAAYGGTPWPTQWTNLCNGFAISSFYRVSSSRNTVGRLVAGAQDNGSFYYDGTSWFTIFGGDGMDNYLDPNNNDFVMGASQFGNFSISYDGGFSSQSTFSNPNGENAEWTTPIVADYNQAGTMYIGNENVVKSTDYGNSWTSLATLPVSGIANNEICALAVANSNGNYIYAAKRVRYEFSIPGSVYVTANGGSSWTDITAGLPDSLYYTSMDVKYNSATTAYVSMAGFSAGNKVFKTTNGGTNWQNLSYNLPNIPVNCVKNIPGTGKLMAATDIGIYVLDSNATTWVSQSVGLPNVIIQDIEFNPALNKVYIATFGRGLWSADLSVLANINEHQAAELGVELSPNINHGSFTIHLLDPEFVREDFTLEVVDVKGQIVSKENLSGSESYQENLNLSPGVYFAKIKSAQHSGVKRFVVQ